MNVATRYEVEALDAVSKLEHYFLEMPQVECPVEHIFGPGTYTRKVTIPAGTFAIGHAQKTEHMNIMLEGRVSIRNEDGTVTELKAPQVFVGKPGRKVGYVHEKMVWLNVYPTQERDVEKLEATYLDKSVVWLASHEAKQQLLAISNDVDRQDFLSVLDEFGFTEEVAKAQSENESDQIPFPDGAHSVMVSDSRIHGKGLFATSGFEADDVIAPARLGSNRTPAGRFTNHSKNPNALMVLCENGDIALVAIKPIKGCAAGELGDEVTIDYREALKISLNG